MITPKYLLLLLLPLSLQHCASNQTLWVAGIQADCAAGAGQQSCLLVHRGAEPAAADWEFFYTNITGFTFEEGYAKQILVKTQRTDPQQTPADASTMSYTLVRELDRRPDPRSGLRGEWTLARLRGNPLNRMVVLPTLAIDLAGRHISGSGGCNTYSGPIEGLGWEALSLGNIVRTERACINENIESEYYQALAEVSRFGFADDLLVFFNEAGEQLLSYMPKQESQEAPQQLHDIWAATRIEGSPIDRSSPTPSLEIHLDKMRIMGNDGCNQYNGAIEAATATQLAFGPLAATKKMCRDMDVPNRYNRALQRVAAFRLEGLTLTLLDADGAEVLTFLKVD